MNDRKQIDAVKAWSLFGVLANMRIFAAAVSQTLTGRRPRKYSPAYYAVAPATRPGRVSIRHRQRSPEHVAAVAAMRAARRLKRIRRAERLIMEKRTRQRGQTARHYRRLFKRGHFVALDSYFGVSAPPHRYRLWTPA